MKRTISIIGPIGANFTFQGKEINGVTLADVVAQVTALPKETTELVIQFDTPGGLVSEGQSIYSYLKSVEHRFVKGITSKQIGDIGSIGTIAWFAGSKRIAAKGINPATKKAYRFMIHNPFMLSAEGDAAELKRHSDNLKLTEDEMAQFYIEQTGITKEGIAPLMKAETFFDGPQAVDLKFATDIYEPQSIAAIHNTTNKGSNQMEKTLKEKVLALLGITVAVAPPAELMGKPVQIDGKPAVDGIYTVVGGVITQLAEATPAQPAAPAATGAAAPPVAADMQKILALLEAQPKQEKAIAAAVAEATKKFNAEIMALKKSIKTEHVPAAFTPETKADDVKEWERSFKANEHAAMRKDDPEKYQRLFYSKYGRTPN